MRRLTAIALPALAALALLAGCGSSSSSSNDNAASTTPPATSTPDTTSSDSGGEAETIKTTSGKLGTYLVDGEGKTLYLFLKDKKGSGASTCSDACAAAWPPVTTDGAPSASAGAGTSMLGTIKRADGTTQVTYNGWPLYYYAGDKSAGDTTGQGLDDSGAKWYVLDAKGDKIDND